MSNAARNFLDSISGYANTPGSTTPTSSADRPVVLATIDPNYTSGLARVTFDGEGSLTQRGYAWDAAYTPKCSDRVFMVPVGQSYIIGGRIQTTVPFNQYVPLNYNTGWSDYDTSSYNGGGFTKTPSGLVKLSGVIKASAGNSATVATLPSGFTPSASMYFPVLTNGRAGGITIYTDGSVKFAFAQDYDPIWVSLNNIVFPTETLNWVTPALLNGWTSPSTNPMQYAIDSRKRIWLRGDGSAAAALSADQALFQMNTASRVQLEHHLIANTGVAGTVGQYFAFAGITPDGTVSWKYPSTLANICLDGIMVHDVSTTWTVPTLLNSWANFDPATYPPAGYTKDDDGTVHLRGLVKTGAVGTTIFVLPVGMRPSKALIRETVSANALGRVDIRYDGTIVVIAGSSTWVSLNGISFTAEQ